MSAAKARKAKAKAKTKAKPAKAKRAKAKRAKAKTGKAKTAKVKSAKPDSTRPFRYTAAQTVQIRFAGEKKPETFRVDDMVEATIAALDGETRLYFQYRLISNDKQNRDGSDRCFWFLDPKPVGVAGAMAPTLWQRASEQTLDGYDVVIFRELQHQKRDELRRVGLAARGQAEQQVSLPDASRPQWPT